MAHWPITCLEITAAVVVSFLRESTLLPKKRADTPSPSRVEPEQSSREIADTGMLADRPDLALSIIAAEYVKNPDLVLSVPEAASQFGFSEPLCERLLDHLVSIRVLRKTATGAYVKQ
jgi:hypothetical protein